MLNVEKHLNEIKEQVKKTGSFSMLFGKIQPCNVNNCNDCEFILGKYSSNCVDDQMFWLFDEYKEEDKPVNRITEILMDELYDIECSNCRHRMFTVENDICKECTTSRSQWAIDMKNAEYISSRIINAVTKELSRSVL